MIVAFLHQRKSLKYLRQRFSTRRYRKKTLLYRWKLQMGKPSRCKKFSNSLTALKLGI